MSLRIGKEGEIVSIVKSYELEEMKLVNLIGEKGIITSSCMNNSKDNRGYWVRLLGANYMGDTEWFIPYTSINIANKKDVISEYKNGGVFVEMDEETGTAHVSVE